MRFVPDNFLYLIKQLVTGRNGDDTVVVGSLVGSGTSSATSADGGIKVDKEVPLIQAATPVAFPVITNNTGGAATTTWPLLTGTYATDYGPIAGILTEIANVINAQHTQAIASVSGIPAIVLAAGATAISTFSFPIPRDYDEASDHLFIRVLASLASGDTLTTGYLTGTPTIQPIATGTATAGSAVKATAPFQTSTLLLTTTEQVFEISLSANGLKRDDIVTVALAIVGTTSAGLNVFAIEKTYDSTIVSYNETDATGNNSGTLPGFGNPLR